MRTFLFIVCVCFIQAQTLPKASELGAPEGYQKVFEFQTLPTSVQIYTCKVGAADVFSWAGPDPDAVLMSRDKKLTVHHYKGPTWEAMDGSSVQGSNAKHFQATRPKSVDWLELTAKNGSKKFDKVGFIHRIETEGGVAPEPVSHPCDATHGGEQIRVPYGATYVFFGSK